MLGQGHKDKDPLRSCLPTLLKRDAHSLARGEEISPLHCLLDFWPLNKQSSVRCKEELKNPLLEKTNKMINV